LYLKGFKRDWGHAKDYVRMMWMILQAEEAEDWVVAQPLRRCEFVRNEFAGSRSGVRI
jgi:GDPmannose 4,6-dehydratase